ncbi:unnamed protein product [Cylicocyclus nassatus]|uniref:Uncharacterized protein n=1 Tax=Cylicocyclus nassatus TaxID=53992 RepID=A0AA36DUX3_CYLNA|nr:unnamed protein product [Cylicocyclus nassatus]
MDDDENIENALGNLSEIDRDRRHPCSKIFVRTVTIITCIHMIIHRRVTPVQDELIRCRTLSFIMKCQPNPDLDQFADPDVADIIHFIFRWLMFGSFPMLSLAALVISALLLRHWPRLIDKITINPTFLHVFCLFSLFYMFLESMFQAFAYMYGISSASTAVNAPWTDYLLSSLYSILLWFFFLNFLVNMQLTEFDCRAAREIAGGIINDQNPPADHQ